MSSMPFEDSTVVPYGALTFTQAFAPQRLTSLMARSLDLWNIREESNTGKFQPSRVPAESDPSKREPSDLPETRQSPPRDLPADEGQESLQADTGRNPDVSQA